VVIIHLLLTCDILVFKFCSGKSHRIIFW